MLRLQKCQITTKQQQQQETQQQRSNRLERHRRSTQKYRRKLNNMDHCKQTKKSYLSLDQNIQQFKSNINNGPYFICVICNKMLYKVSVQQFMEGKYSDVTKNIAHKDKSYENKLNICHTCHLKLKRRKIPAQAVINKMKLDEIPPELKCLHKLESVLISQRIIFEKIVVMPKDQQKKIQGKICNIPINCDTICSSLPRPSESSGILLLKLKRKLAYHSHQYFEAIRPSAIHDALCYLKANNMLYHHVDIAMENIESDMLESQDLNEHIYPKDSTFENDVGEKDCIDLQNVNSTHQKHISPVKENHLPLPNNEAAKLQMIREKVKHQTKTRKKK